MPPIHMIKNKGFTLIELMITVAIIGVLAAIAFPQYQNYARKAALTTAVGSANNYQTIVEEYVDSHYIFPEISAAFAIGTLQAQSGAVGNNNLDAKITQGVGEGTLIRMQRNAQGSWQCWHNQSDLYIGACAYESSLLP
ncbi:pilin [Vibrio hibernica]|uniref:pilin n=2 Tax=Vibrio hibernica TaxID=2587465 RepID=UPI0039AF3D8A